MKKILPAVVIANCNDCRFSRRGIRGYMRCDLAAPYMCETPIASWCPLEDATKEKTDD
jgi:hypothetical protein